MSRDLLILSAELISADLQFYFGKLPSTMVPFQNLPALDYIYHENINHYDNIYVVVMKEYQFVKEFLAHTQYKIKTILLPEIGDLAYSLQYGLEQIFSNREVSILFGDTYMPYMTSFFNQKDVIMYGHSLDSERWTVVQQNKENEIRFIDKEYLPKQDQYQVVIGVFHIINPALLIDALKSNEGCKGSRFYTGLQDYIKSKEIDLIYSSSWVDYGHSDKYFEQKRRVASRAFNDVQIDTKKNIVQKKSSHTAKFIDEINWFLKLPQDLSKYIPTIYEYSLAENNPYVKMEFLDMLTLHEVFIHGNHSIERWKTILLQLKKVNAELVKHQATTNQGVEKKLLDMYVTKTKTRLDTFKKQKLVDATKPLIINGKEYLSLNEYINKIEKIAIREGILEDKVFNIIQGDFCFPNILYDLIQDKVILIDPRGSFGNSGIFGDNLYEWAKLAHSVDGGYDLIIADRFNIINMGNNITYTIHKHSIHEKIKELFYSEIVEQSEVQKIKLIQALLFFGMLPLHSDSKKRQRIMLCKAVELFDPFLNNSK